MKFAFVSEYLPPSTHSPGGAGMIYRLLAPLDPAQYCLISRGDYDSDCYAQAPNRLPATYHRVSSGVLPALDGSGRRAARRRSAPAIPRRLGNVLGRAWKMAAILKLEGCSAVVACPDRVGDLPTAFLASRLARARFLPYFFDYYSAWFNRGPSGLVARRPEPVIIKRAAAVIVPNEGLRDTLARRYGVEAAVIHNACDLSVYQGPTAAPRGHPDVGAGEDGRVPRRIPTDPRSLPGGIVRRAVLRRHDCGLVVSTQDPDALAQALGRLRVDTALRERLSVNAWARARADFDLARARADFAGLFGISPAGA